METEQREEFYAIREEAYNGLQSGKYIDRFRSVSVCRYLILPSFENPVSWDVIRVVARRAEAQTRLYRSCWRMDIDQQAMRSPIERLKHPRPYTPTIEVNCVSIDRNQVEAVLSQIRFKPIPLAIEHPPAGCDGTSFELALGDFFCNARIRWWCDLPTEWKDLKPVVAELKQLFERAWENAAKPDIAPDRTLPS